MMDEESSESARSELRGVTRAELARSVRRAADAGIPVAVVDLLGSGQEFTPSRGRVGRWYRPDENVVRELGKPGIGALAAGVALYPPPDPETERVIVLPMAQRNWLPYEENLERILAVVVDTEEKSRSRGSQD
jgi:hypothetical protein